MDYGNSYKKASSSSGSSSGLTDKGVWDSAVSYAVNDIVRYSNSLYKCIQAIIPGSPVLTDVMINAASVTYPNGSAVSVANLSNGNYAQIAIDMYNDSTRLFVATYGTNQNFNSVKFYSDTGLPNFYNYGYLTGATVLIDGISISNVIGIYNSTEQSYTVSFPTTNGKVISVAFLNGSLKEMPTSQVKLYTAMIVMPTTDTTHWSFFGNALANLFLPPVTFAMNAPVADCRTVPYMVKNACAISEITILTDVVPTASTTFLLFLNGAQIASIALTTASSITALTQSLAAGDILYAKISGAVNGIGFATVEVKVV